MHTPKKQQMCEHFQEIKYQIIFKIVGVPSAYVIVYVKSKPSFNVLEYQITSRSAQFFCRHSL